MKVLFSYVFLILSGLVSANSGLQIDSIPQFTAPLNIPMFLAGNFGEIRGGHFHAGIDIKTQQVEGLPVFAAADGYISRVKIALGGYGNVIYITHPNGYTTVYGHLQKFNTEINKHVLAKQYQLEKFTIELFFTPNQLPVKQGQEIALSGNSGGSGGPHLHFEIRKTKGGLPQNPLKFGFDIKDNIRPTLKNLAIYPINDTSIINGKHDPVFIPLKKAGNKYTLSSNDSIFANGVIGFGLEAIDKLNGSNNRCGVYNITLKADSSTIYEHQMDQLNFATTRYINTHVDFYETKKNKRRIQKSYLTTHNPLQIYKNIRNKGLVYFSKYNHNLNYLVSDVYGNNTSLDFKVYVDSTLKTTDSVTAPKPDTVPIFKFDQSNLFETENIKITFPKYCFYEDINFNYSMADTINNGVAPVHQIMSLYDPLQKYIYISMRVPATDSSLSDKYFAVSLTSKNKVISPEGGSYKEGWLTFKTRSLGPYTVLVDTTPPVIKPINFNSSTKNISNLSQLKLKITDNLSGIKSFDAYIDGKWQLMEFDPKTGIALIDLSHHSPSIGEHDLLVKIGDSVNNFKAFTFNFIW